MRACGANKPSLGELADITAIFIADDRAIPALRTLDPHLRDVIDDALSSIDKGLHIIDRLMCALRRGRMVVGMKLKSSWPIGAPGLVMLILF